jgi:hypothetical protein
VTQLWQSKVWHYFSFTYKLFNYLLIDNNKDDVFEHLDGSEDPFSVIWKYYSDIRKSSSAKQLTIGAISGWTAGVVMTKFGRTAAAAVGGTWLLLHVFNCFHND